MVTVMRERKLRHFLKLSDLAPKELRGLVARAIALKTAGDRGFRPLQGRTLAMLFSKSSTRTRVSFEVAMAQLGGHALFLSPRDLQLGRGEPLADTARVLSGMCDAILVRNDSHAEQEQVSRHARIPVINGLSELHHPCQLLADIMTFQEIRGDVMGKTVAWIGDGNNVCNSWVEAARLLGFRLRIACPEGFEPNAGLLESAKGIVQVVRDRREAAEAADLVVTDVWASMGQESERERRREALSLYQVDSDLMAMAKPKALFMHCLPAHRGEEVTAEVIDGRQSAVWQEAENRLHAQKALLELLIKPPESVTEQSEHQLTMSGVWRVPP